MGNKKKIIAGLILAISLAGLTACGNKSKEAPVVDQTEVATSGSENDVNAGSTSEAGTPAANGSVDANGKPVVDLSKLVYAKTADIATKAFTRVITEGAKIVDKASLSSKVAPTADDYGKGIGAVSTDVPFAKINVSGTTPKITILAESGKFKCSVIMIYSASTGSKPTELSCK